MDDYCYVDMIGINNVSINIPTESYEFKPKNEKHQAMWDELMEAGCLTHHMEKTMGRKMFRINSDDLIQKATKHMMNISSYAANPPTNILMGLGEHFELTGHKESYSFYEPPKYNTEGKLFNLNLKVVPHMKGLLVY